MLTCTVLLTLFVQKVNDGFGGGDDISTNLIFNMVRESKDHGPYNSWDRVPYITTLRNGTPSIVPADKHIHNNFIVGTYNSQECIDTDDGSAYIQTYDNVFAYGAGGECVRAHTLLKRAQGHRCGGSNDFGAL